MVFSGALCGSVLWFFFFFNDPAPTEIYPLSLPAALPISDGTEIWLAFLVVAVVAPFFFF